MGACFGERFGSRMSFSVKTVSGDELGGSGFFMTKGSCPSLSVPISSSLED